MVFLTQKFQNSNFRRGKTKLGDLSIFFELDVTVETFTTRPKNVLAETIHFPDSEAMFRPGINFFLWSINKKLQKQKKLSAAKNACPVCS